MSNIQEHDDVRLLPDKRLNKNPTHQQSKRCNSNDFQEVECRLVDTISSYIIFDAGISWFLHSLDSSFKFYIFQQVSVSTIVNFFFNSELLAFFDTSPIAVFNFFDQSQSFKLANTEKNSSMIFFKWSCWMFTSGLETTNQIWSDMTTLAYQWYRDLNKSKQYLLLVYPFAKFSNFC